MKSRSFILCLPLFVLILSCEGSRLGRGVVFDNQTQTPLDSVMYKDINESFVFYSDSLGNYTIEGPFGGCVSECPDYKVAFSKDGYKTKIVENPNGNIFLELE
jgi:hypothetical protein